MGVQQSTLIESNVYSKYEGNNVGKRFFDHIGDNNFKYIQSFNGLGKCGSCDDTLKGKETVVLMCKSRHQYHLDCLISKDCVPKCNDCNHII